MQNWDSVPWDTDLAILHSLESGLVASETFQDDLLTAKKDGEDKLKLFFLKHNHIKWKLLFLNRISMSKRSNFTNPLKEENVEKSRKTNPMEN